MNNIDKEEILKGSKWVRFFFMVVYAFAINFVISISIGLAFVQFLFYLFTSKPNSSISTFNDYLLEFVSDTLAFLLFSTEDKPFPFKPEISDDIEEDKESEIIDAVVEPEVDQSEDQVNETEEKETKD
tara:strand:+ start:3338 stop:3721 length:384 start_codon:yes stop_codon:yes gene_type:complete